MAIEISIPINDDGTIPMACAGGLGIVQLCGCDAGCDNLPPRIKVTIQGTAEFNEDIHSLDIAGTPREETRHRVAIPPVIFTMDKGGGSAYQTTLDCPALVSGRSTRRHPGFAPGTFTDETGSVQELRIVTLVATQTAPGEPCILSSVGILARGATNNDGPVEFVLSANYASNRSQFLGVHGSFGTTINPSPNGTRAVGRAETTLGTLDATPTIPAVWEHGGDFGQAQHRHETSFASWIITIEAWDDDPICDASPIVYATRCGDDSPSPERITVDLVDRLENTHSLPFFDGSVWVPTADQSTEPVDTHDWVEGECDTETFPLWARCDDDTDTILVNEWNMPDGTLTALIGQVRYRRTGEVGSGTPVEVEWTLDPCPTPDSIVWERCHPGGNIIAPGRIRTFRPSLDTADFIYATFRTDFPSIGYPDCHVLSRVAYHKIGDDGGDYPEHSLLAPWVAPSCNAMPDSQVAVHCNLGDVGDPTEPNGQNLTQPERPNPMQAQIDQFINPRCPSCGG